MARPRKRPAPRRALNQQGGPARSWGPEREARALAHAMDVAKLDPDRLTHGFHSYPARMHWAIAERALQAFAPDDGRVLDPFCGSGTTVIEARARGLSAAGMDLNPLALRLSALKTSKRGPNSQRELLSIARQVAAASEERVRARVPAQAKLPRGEIQWYAPHVLKEMAGLLEEIGQVENERHREALTLVFSANVIKLSKQRGDTSEGGAEKRLRKGLVTEFFLRKVHELCERFEAYRRVATGPAVKLMECDARELSSRVRKPVDLILSSPPYGGTYDYVAHHQRRFAWLGIRPQALERGEIGARRHGGDAARFDEDLLQVLRGMGRVLAPRGQIVLLMGDGHMGARRLPADKQFGELAPRAGLKLVAGASQSRQDFAGKKPRREHLLLLRKA